MENVLKSVVLLGLVGGIVFLSSHNLSGWGWLVFLFVLTLITTGGANGEINED
jgi:hypothetical protein